jgi:hypothetical protein
MAGRTRSLVTLAIAIGVAAGTGVVWLAQSGPETVDCFPGSSSNTPLVTSMALGPPLEQTVGSDHWYNFSIQAAATGWELHNLDVEVQSSGGGIVAPGSAWSLTVSNAAGAPLTIYALSGTPAGTWATGSSLPITSDQSIDLLTAPNGVSGDTFVVIEVGATANGCPAQGSISEAIP